MLLTLTLITVALVVVALAGYLIAIAWALLQARRSVAGIADGLEAVVGTTQPLPEMPSQFTQQPGPLTRRGTREASQPGIQLR